MKFHRAVFLFLALCGVGIHAQEAPELKLATVFGSHMVLQQGKPTSIWGQAGSGKEITVSFGSHSVKTTADQAGQWSLNLPSLKTSRESRILTASDGVSTVTLEDVLVGEVWMCSGQSNMGWTLNRSLNPDAAAAAANHPHLRLFTTPTTTAATPQRDVKGGEWRICTPESAPVFSAVGYYFGRELLQNLDVPIGMINTAWGGKPSEAFTSRETLETVPSARPLLAEWDAKQAAFDSERARANYEKALTAWQERVAKLKAEGKQAREAGRRPTMPTEPNLQPNAPSAIYHQMVAPWTPYAIAGAIWYQGESNAPRARQYETLFPALIEDWRRQRKDDFPFYFVQLANFRAPSEEPGTPSDWAELQNAQTLTLQKVPNTGMAIINDIGEAEDIHPKNKEDVGKRLALWALGEHYGKEQEAVSGPIFHRAEVVSGGIRVHFDHVGKGLKSRDGEKLGRFEVAGEDRKWVWAEAQIEASGKSVLVSGSGVKNPVAARYAWASNPEGANLVNSAGLPASLFRSDDWDLMSDGVETLEEASARRALVNLDRTHERLRQGGWEILFNGKNLEGWKNPYSHGEAKVSFGEIHLLADKKFFLVTEKTYGDFSLTAEIRLPEGKANSGIMFRCHVEPGKVYGYQAECDGSERRWSGGLYDEGRRQWIWPSTEGRSEEKFLAHEEESKAFMAKPEVAGALKRNEWNRYQITCRGNRIQIRVNGVMVTNFEDDLDQEGYIGLQHHGEDGQVYRFRNIYLKPL